MRATPPAPCEDDELAADVEEALRGSTELADLHAAAERLRSQPERLLAKIRFNRNDPDLLEALAERSYRHANGFIKVKLIAMEQFSVRLHLWPPSTSSRGDTNPHGHRWAFASWVVCGAGMHERFYERSQESDSTAQPYYRHLFGAVTDSSWYVEPVERVWLTRTDLLDRKAGAVYTCPLRTVHTVGPRGDGFVATVVVQGPHVAGRVPVYAPAGRCPKAYERPIPAAELSDELIALERALESLGTRSP